MMTKEWTTKIVIFMTLKAWAVLDRDHISRIMKMYFYVT